MLPGTAGNMDSEWALLKSSIAEMVAAGCGWNVVDACCGGKPKKFCPEKLKALDEVGILRLTHLSNIAWESGTVPGDWQTCGGSHFKKKKGTRGCVPIIEESHLSACLGKPINCRTSIGGGTMRIAYRMWNIGPAFYPGMSPGGGMGVCLSSLHVFSIFEEGL